MDIINIAVKGKMSISWNGQNEILNTGANYCELLSYRGF